MHRKKSLSSVRSTESRLLISSANCTRQPSPSTPSSSSTSTPEAHTPASPHPNPLAERVITTRRKVQFNFLDSKGFSIGNLLSNMGWGKLCSLDVPTYPALVRKFYATAGRGDDGLFAIVKGTCVRVNQTILSNLLEMFKEGMIATNHSDHGGTLTHMLGREVGNIEEVYANQFSLELRLLHNICARILLPKTGRFDFVYENDVMLMDCILNGHPPNLPGMMLSYMGEACTKKKVNLPYNFNILMLKLWKSRLVSHLCNLINGIY